MFPIDKSYKWPNNGTEVIFFHFFSSRAGILNSWVSLIGRIQPSHRFISSDDRHTQVNRILSINGSCRYLLMTHSTNFWFTYIWAPLLILPFRIISSPAWTDFGNAAINGITVIFVSVRFAGNTLRNRSCFHFFALSQFNQNSLNYSKEWPLQSEHYSSCTIVQPSPLSIFFRFEISNSIVQAPGTRHQIVPKLSPRMWSFLIYTNNYNSTLAKDTLRKALVTFKNKSISLIHW